MRLFRNLLLALIAIGLGWVVMSQREEELIRQTYERSRNQSKRTRKLKPRGVSGIVAVESAKVQMDDKIALRVPSQEPQPVEIPPRETNTDADAFSGERRVDRRLQRIEKALSEYDDEDFDERAFDDATLLEQMSDEDISFGRRSSRFVDEADDLEPSQPMLQFDSPDGSADRLRDGEYPYEGQEEDFLPPSAR